MRGTKAIVNLQAIRENAELAKSISPDSNLICVVKANAYGHGATQVAKALDDVADAFGVALFEEAKELKNSGITSPILMMEGCLSEAELPEVSSEGFWTVIHSEEQLKAIESFTEGDIAKVAIKFDTGMHRLGFLPEQAEDVIARISVCDHIKSVMLMTHFANADELLGTDTKKQLSKFKDIADKYDYECSITNSPALLGWPETRSDWNRAGLMLYGSTPFDHAHELADKLRPAQTLQAPIIAIRDVEPGESVGYGHIWTADRPSRIATLAIGYADGYPRTTAGVRVFVNGQRAKLAGRVSMDMVTLDVTHAGDVKVGDMVEMWGENISINEVAKASGTLSYELMTRISYRVPVEYIEG